MLRELSVQNLALIEDVRVELALGFCAWTGETGAGKSLLLGAIGLLLGDRGSADLLRAGKDELRITGRFELATKEQKAAVKELLQSDIEDDLVITRRLARNGRSSALVDEHPVSVSTLKKLGEMLVDVHGQRESHSLLQPAYQLELLDAFGKLGELRQRYVTVAERVRELRKTHRELAEARQARQRELALVQFERDDLDAARLQTGELESLQKEREKLVHAQSLMAFTGNVAAKLLDDEDSFAVVLSRLIKEAGKWAALDKKLAEVASRLSNLKPELQDLAETCRDLSESFEANPERLDEIERRLQLFRKLESKYGKSIPELVLYRGTLDLKDKELRKQELDLSGTEKALRTIFEELKSAAAALGKARAKVAKKLAAEAQKHIADLQMPKAKLEAELVPVPLGDDPFVGELPAAGTEQLELLLAANPGEPSRPLRKIASGGELSRTMLALKTVLASHDPVRTLVVFDEIDANVGGRLGDVLGQKLANLGKTHQVLCVTHLPQVASYARFQWTIRKSTNGKKTSTTIVPLTTDSERVEELATMLRGEARSDSTRAEAKAMLKQSQR